jgi:hypothetical protein
VKTFTKRTTRLEPRVVDQLLEFYVCWREESVAARIAYERWSDCDRSDRRLGYAGYAAALDREQLAAHFYAEQVLAVGVVLR